MPALPAVTDAPCWGRVYYSASLVPRRQVCGWCAESEHRLEDGGTQDMEWVYDPITQASSLVSGIYRCTVRRTTAGQWSAVISAQGQGTDAYSFDTLAEAQAWCEARVTELTARKRR